MTVRFPEPPTTSGIGFGSTAIEFNVGGTGLTVTTDDATRPDAEWVAVMVAVPFPTAVTSPAPLTVATPDDGLAKVDPAFRLSVEPSE